MARSRNIKPGFYLNEELAQCSMLARYIFPGLWMMADRAGRLEDRPLRIKAAVLPYDNGDVNKMLDELQDAGLILRYSVDGQKYIQVLNFEKHQSPHYKEPESTIPEPNDSHKSPRLSPQSSNGKPEAFSQEIDLIEGETALIPDSGYLITDYLIPEKGAEGVDTLQAAKTKPPPPQIDYSKNKQFQMHGDWEPSPSFDSLAKIAGLVLGDDTTVNSLMEFKAYWITHPEKLRTQGEWEHAFIKSLKADASMGRVPIKRDNWRKNDESILAKARELGIGTAGLDRFQLIAKIEAKLQ